MVDIRAGDEMEIELTEETLLPMVDESDITKSSDVIDSEGSDESKPTSTELDSSKTNVTEFDFTETDSATEESESKKREQKGSDDLKLIEADEDLQYESEENNLQNED